MSQLDIDLKTLDNWTPSWQVTHAWLGYFKEDKSKYRVMLYEMWNNIRVSCLFLVFMIDISDI